MTEKDKARFVAVFMAFLSYSQNAFIKWRQGLLINMAGARRGKAFWTERAYLFSEVSPTHGKRFDETRTGSRHETDGRL